MSTIFTISWTNMKSAIVSGILAAIVSMAVYVIGLGDIFKTDLHSLINIGAISLLTTIVSLLKSFMTTSSGSFLGLTKVVPPTE